MVDIFSLFACYSISTSFVIIGLVSIIYALKRKRQTFHESHEDWVFALFEGLAVAVLLFGVLFFVLGFDLCYAT